MEQHPIPQNVTTFQFRLIGDMTIKQFGYLASGAILAYIFYKLPLPFFLGWPLSVLSAIAGFGFAFVPIEERPMDVWVLSFFRSIYSPTQYVWQKSKPTAEPATRTVKSQSPAAPTVPHSPPPQPAAQVQPVAPIQTTKATPVTQVLHEESHMPQEPPVIPAPVVVEQKKPNPFADWLANLFRPKSKAKKQPTREPERPQAPPYVPAFSVTLPPSVTGKRVEPPPPSATSTPQPRPPVSEEAQKRAAELEEKLKKLQEELKGKVMTEERILELQRQLTEVLDQKGKLETELASIRQKLSAKPELPRRILEPDKVTLSTQPTVKIITPESAVKAGLPKLTTIPNVVTGIIRDGERSLLPGVLVTVRDKDDVPLRALKTNRLGQFAASTPLVNGTYLVEVEDPRGRYIFDRVQITLNGSVMPALEIVAKNQKQLARDKLAKEIFGDKPA
jgi:hypothetical protein